MNYRHIYHAGNFADVAKHISLIILLKKFKEKEKPFAVLDAFAGLGLYDLQSEQAQKTLESENGVRRLLSYQKVTPIIQEYLDLVKKYNGSYPGSPIIIASMLRSKDRLIAAELHPADYATLKYNMRRYQNSHIHHIDAYNAIKAFCPFQEKRGLILLDPAFEVKDEFNKILDAMALIKKRFAGSTIMLWYPVKDRLLVDKFYTEYKKIGFAETISFEFAIKATEGMNRCGVLIANPPYIEQELQDAMKSLTVAIDGKFSQVKKVFSVTE